MASPWRIERFDKSQHDRSDFDCGKAPLTEWIQKYVSQYERKDLCRTYVATRHGESRILGYYTVSNHRVTYETLPENEAKGLPNIGIPVALIGRLAVDASVQGLGLGKLLLLDSLRRVSFLADRIGIRAVEVEAIDDDARRFYQRYGFISLRDDPKHLILTLRVVRELDLPPLETRI